MDMRVLRFHRPGTRPGPRRDGILRPTRATGSVWVVLLSLLLVACGQRAATHSNPGATATPSASSAPTATLAPGALKPLIIGLTNMGSLAFHATQTGIPDNTLAPVAAYPGSVDSTVINVTWLQLQPTQQSFDPSAIDQALSAITAYNQAHTTSPLVAKLRVFGGNNAPDWVKTLPGGPITISSRFATFTVGPFWSAPYIQAWRALQAQLAARYDANPLIDTVATSSCSSVSDEPFILPLNQPSVTNLLAAGFTDAAYQSCLMGQNDDYAAWKQTRIEETFNAYHQIGAGVVRLDQAVTNQAMALCRSALGARCILSNHGLQLPSVVDANAVYSEMKSLGGPISLQDYSPQTLQSQSNGVAVISKALSIGASSVEIWPIEFTKFSASDVQSWAALFPRG